MEELTIGDKTYISSKRAAEITGYAKDYVGQLCREGRVEATLVGRSWYVLESSIRSHRFGDSTEDESDVSKAGDSIWQPSVYKAEEAPVMPPLTPSAPRRSINLIDSRPVAAPAAESPETIADMQTAWKEWFSMREEVAKPERTPVEASPEVKEREEEPALPVTEQIIEDDEPDPVPFTAVREEPVLIQRRAVEQVSPTRPAPPIGPAPRRPKKRRGSSYLALKALFVAVMLLALTLAIIGTGAVDSNLTQKQPGFDVVRFLGGANIVESNE